MARSAGKKLLLDNPNTYQDSSLEVIRECLLEHFDDLTKVSVEDIKGYVDDLNAHPDLPHLEDLSEDHVHILDESKVDTAHAEKLILEGRFFWEHAAAGEATRLGLGTKYLINLSRFPVSRIQKLILDEAEKDIKKSIKDDDEQESIMAELREKYSEENLLKSMGCAPEDLLDLSLGQRHMLQMVYDVRKLARKHRMDPEEVLKRQHTIIAVNESTAEAISSEFMKYDFYGLDPSKVFFIIQKSFHGIDLKGGKLKYDTSHNRNKRLHNHGQLVMQKAHDYEVFHFAGSNRVHLSAGSFEGILAQHEVLVSYNIEDTAYLTGAVDWHSLALSLELADKGYSMVMEIVGQNPENPQKGGAAFFNSALGKPCMVEVHMLKGIKNEDIKYLNKNFNHYLKPAEVFNALKSNGLNFPIDVKLSEDRKGNPKYYIYQNPVQGDINFLVNTAFVMRKELKPIKAWKSPATTPPTIKAMHEQDLQPGFKELVGDVIGID